MGDVGAMVGQLIAAGCAADVAARIVSEAFVAGVLSANSTGIPPDSTAEKRRAYDRERKRKSAEFHRNSTGIPERPIDSNNSIKKERARATQIPPEWKPDAELWAWSIAELGTLTRTEKELDKFRDHFGAKGSTAKNWAAAWRNWVRRSLEYSPRAAPPALSVVGEKIPIEEAVAQFAKLGRLSRYSPINDISQAPPELLAKHGLLPDGRKSA